MLWCICTSTQFDVKPHQHLFSKRTGGVQIRLTAIRVMLQFVWVTLVPADSTESIKRISLRSAFLCWWVFFYSFDSSDTPADTFVPSDTPYKESVQGIQRSCPDPRGAETVSWKVPLGFLSRAKLNRTIKRHFWVIRKKYPLIVRSRVAVLHAGWQPSTVRHSPRSPGMTSGERSWRHSGTVTVSGFKSPENSQSDACSGGILPTVWESRSFRAAGRHSPAFITPLLSLAACLCHGASTHKQKIK